MKTVKEVSALTGISVRTLHYYDQIGLLAPSGKSQGGYRLYDDAALERLQQILFFREFDIPLGRIKELLADPALDRERILKMQRRMLAAKKERLERLIAGIDELLKGEKQVDFAIFDRNELEEMFRVIYERIPEQLRQTAVEEFGGLERWREHYLRAVASPEMQRMYAKMVEWYGGKTAYLDSLKRPVDREVVGAFTRREQDILKRLAEKRDCPPDSLPVRELVGEYGFILKNFLQVREEAEAGVMLSLAGSFAEPRVKTGLEERYGAGSAEFFARAIRGFYGEEGE